MVTEWLQIPNHKIWWVFLENAEDVEIGLSRRLNSMYAKGGQVIPGRENFSFCTGLFTRVDGKRTERFRSGKKKVWSEKVKDKLQNIQKNI